MKKCREQSVNSTPAEAPKAAPPPARTRVEVCPQSTEAMPWKVTVNSQTMESFPTQERAAAAAVSLCRRIESEGGKASLLIKREDGTIREERTYPRSSDPERTPG